MKPGGATGASFLRSVNGPMGESLTAIIVLRMKFGRAGTPCVGSGLFGLCSVVNR